MEEGVNLRLGHRYSEEPARLRVERSLAWAAPRLPEASETKVPRWSAGPTWTPPGTNLLVRHRALDGSGRIITNDRVPPAGYEIEFDLGLVHTVAQPGTARLIATEDDFITSLFEGTLDRGLLALGYVELAPLPLLESLELRRDENGHVTLVAGPADPLYQLAEPLGRVGFIESYPINPRELVDVYADRHLRTLYRLMDEPNWTHHYTVGVERPVEDLFALGGLFSQPRVGLIELRVDADGTIGSDLLSSQAARARTVSKSAVRWTGAPLTWEDGLPRAWAARATLSRARRLALTTRASASRRGGGAQPSVLGYIRSTPAEGWSPLFSARHPVLADQYLTRSELEALDMGYVVEGVVGHLLDRRAELTRSPHEIKWASRFGQRRRYVEGAVE
jgi:hypothetical protein